MGDTEKPMTPFEELPQDVQNAINEFTRTGDIPKLDRDLDVCIAREYSLINRIQSWWERFVTNGQQKNRSTD